jgi:mycothiol system anti-sigma-R factor
MSDIKEIGCEEALRRLFEYLDRELDGARHAEMEQHLHTCRACYSRAEFERHLKGKLGAVGKEPSPPEFELRIKNLLRRF